jgi:hypothetical protein
MKTRIMYLENKETGEARIGRVTFSRTFQTVYYKNRTIHRAGSEKIQTASKKNWKSLWQTILLKMLRCVPTGGLVRNV